MTECQAAVKRHRKIRIAIFSTLMRVRLYPFDNSSQLLTCTVK